MADFIPCRIRQLPPTWLVAAAKIAIEHNPANRPVAEQIGYPKDYEPPLTPMRLALLTSKYWGAGGVRLGVAFMDGAPADLQARILQHANAWAKSANVTFLPAGVGNAQVRIARTAGQGYYSYLGTDILSIPSSEQTLNLDSFTMNTPDSEFYRVVRHEIGHTLGFVHEHLRREIVQKLDVNKTLAYFEQTQGWSEADVRYQVLTALEDSTLTETPGADTVSIMCYQLPGSITIDGQPIPGGTDIDAGDYALAAKLYPRQDAPPPPSPPPPGPTAALFTLTFSRAVRAGANVNFHAPVPIPAGVYAFDPKPAGSASDVTVGRPKK